ncbi:MAG: hypothetical protein ACX931_07150 [Saccharospirillum sp.]
MYAIKAALVVIVIAVLTQSVWAESQFYFIAQAAPKGSMTQAGQGEQQVYLRWDMLEGNVPTDIVRFSLLRDGTELRSFPANGVMAPAQIRALYQGDAQQRRLLETVSRMMEEAALDASRPPFDADQYGRAIHDRLQSDVLWGTLASRMDFNLAMARYRGWKDEPGTSGEYLYELIAFNDQGEQRRVGLAEVNLDQPQQMLAPTDFDQVEQSSCDLPDFRDHFSVALNWGMPGASNQADRLASQLFLAGFDLYRTVNNVDTAPSRDLAAEARSLDHDRYGRPRFPDLERVNDSLLTISPDDRELTPEWLETRPDLLKAGLQPGDKRAYYLVPRDLTGQYGPSVETLVVVGDLARPPAPWNVRPFLNEAQQRVELTFRSPTIADYREDWGRDRRFCNPDTANADGYLSYVANDEDCATDTPRRVQLDIDEYLVYRFSTFSEASRFKDSDGDGVADGTERPLGLQCDPLTPFAGYRIPTQQEVEPLPSGEQVRLIDETPAQNKGDVYWYRLASRSVSGRLSLLSEPIRVNFPERALPEPPVVEVTQPGTELCGCTVDTTPDKVWSFFSELTTPQGGNLSVQCSGLSVSPSYALDDGAIAGADSPLCQNETFTSQCTDNATRTFTYTSNDGQSVSCTMDAFNGVNLCQQAAVRIRPDYCQAQVPAPIGVVAGPLQITVTPVDPAHCVSLNQQVDGDSVNLGTSCGSGSATFEYDHVAGEFCGFAVTHDANNNVSATTQIGCRSIPAQSSWTLSPALPRALTPVGDTRLAVQWQLPAQAQSMVEIEVTRREPAGMAPIRTRVPAVAQTEAGLQSLQIDVPAQSADAEQWCLRVRTFAPTAEVGSPRYSQWSAPLCEARLASGVSPPEWLPWPELAEVPEGEPLASHISDDVYFASTTVPISNGVYLPLGEFVYATNTHCQVPVYSRNSLGDVDLTPPESGRYLTDLRCLNPGYARAQSVLGEHLNFMVFRQARAADGQRSGFVQVTPMIERVHWVEMFDEKGTQFLGHRLQDPYVWAFADADQPGRVELVFYDRAGLLNGYDYRYQVVYFDADRRLRQWRATNWLTYQSDSSQLVSPVGEGE